MSTKQLRSNTRKHSVEYRRGKVSIKHITRINDEPEIRFRHIDKAGARKKIQDYINKNSGCLTSEIIEGLLIEPRLVMQTLKELKQDDLVLSKDIE
ncbi:MAG TPA: hypothetical protein VH796_08080 [Nitrososphaeraceae archaeon]|jgi:predicted transcriptional regulator